MYKRQLYNCWTKNLEEVAPYDTIINKTITSIEQAVITNNKNDQFNQEYPKRLESLAAEGTLNSNHTIIPTGSIFKFTKVIHYKDPISLIKTAFIFGEVTSSATGEIYKAQYRWGILNWYVKQIPVFIGNTEKRLGKAKWILHNISNKI